MSARLDCAVCGDRAWMPFTDANVPLCGAHYTEWIREPSCRADEVFAAQGWDGNLTTATPERRKAFGAELAARTVAWAKSQAEVRAA